MMAVMLVSGNPGSKWWIFQPRLRPEGRPEAMRYEFVVSWQERPQRGDSLISVVDQTGPHLIRGMLQRDLLDSRLEWFFRLDPLNTLEITTIHATTHVPASIFLRQSAYISQNTLTSKTGKFPKPDPYDVRLGGLHHWTRRCTIGLPGKFAQRTRRRRTDFSSTES